MTTRERYLEVKELLGAALELEAGARGALLDERCGGDEALRREVESLLAYEAAAPVLSGEPLVSLRPELDDGIEPGERVGPYRIVRRLASGGMGAVYLAEQERPVRRQVALKIILRGLHGGDLLARFRMERQILAGLDHPYVGRLFDAGATDDGRPYFAMELVDGEPIDRYCDRQALRLRGRLELFREVCEAVQFLHQKLVVHRDLKPGNILVTAAGTPKLLDFGIAKLLEPPAWPPQATVLGRLPMTPAYASPELFRHRQVTTASDVYSLGVLLYLLLAGRLPFEVAGLNDAEVGRIVCELEPRRPSAAAGGGRRRRELAGDLDAIVLKALRKEPEKRYSSVEQLADDVGRYLEGRPVAARGGAFRYRAGKFLRRNRLALATAAVFLILTAGFIAALVVQLDRTRAERDRSTQARELFVEIMETADPADEGEDLSPEAVLKRGADLFGDVFLRDPVAQADVLNSLGRLYGARGFLAGAEPFLEEALRLRRGALGEDHPLVGESLLNLAQHHGAAGRYDLAEPLSRRGLGIVRASYLGPHRQLAKAISSHATQLYGLGRYDEAERLYREALQMKVELFGELHLEVATSLATLGNLHLATGDFPQAYEDYRRALEIRRRLLPPGHPKLALSYGQMGSVLYERGDLAAAEPMLRRALELREARYGDQHPDVARSRYKLARVLHQTGRADEAERLYRQALEARCDTSGEDGLRCARVEKNLAALLASRGDLAAAESLARAALATFERSGSTAQADEARGLLGEVLAARGRH